MIIQWILQTLACAVIGCIIGYFGIRITNKLRIFLYKKRNNKTIKESDNRRRERFYSEFGFYYEDIIKYAPELDAFLSGRINQQFKNNVDIKMIAFTTIYDAICTVEKIDIIKFKQTIENIKNQKTLENID